jgi:hypothetical protein
MRENHTQLVIVLDRSGSMDNIADALNNNVISDDEINAWVVPDKKDK